jgi:C4-dicarboxylate-specific signal transduction histidine kinase
LFHIRILIQLLEHFHQAKRRERAFAEQAHLQAIYETGAKLTHDIKNLLQSLHAIASVIQTSQPTQFGTTQRMLQGQIPHLVQRLKSTLDKLQKPTEVSYVKVPLDLWWENLNARYRKMNIHFVLEKNVENTMIPEELFDSVAENLLQNVLSKRKREPDLQIKVILQVDNHHLNLSVCDNGTVIPAEIANQLFSQPVSSRDGYGIGLYQLAKQVSNLGFTLKIDKNAEGRVCFRFSNTT